MIFVGDPMTVTFAYTPYAQAATDRLIVANQIAIMKALRSLLLSQEGILDHRITESDEWLSMAMESVCRYEALRS